jgi:hypothetical protein
MMKFIGAKMVFAKPMSRLDYTVLRGWTLLADENGSDEGYLVEYTDGGAPNHKDFAGYVSWSPKEQFDNAYCVLNGLSFGLALEALKKGCKVARAGWNGAGMFALLVQGSTFTVNRAPLLGIYPEGTEINYRPHIVLKFADGSIATWAPSGSDVLADDWMILDAAYSQSPAEERPAFCPHAAPHVYCATCVADPCPIGLPTGEENTAPALLPHQQRVVDEKAALDTKISKLAKALLDGLGGKVCTEECARLNVQLSVMADYSAILGDRIAAFQ